jgi:lysyl-tRNA synthetase class 1
MLDRPVRSSVSGDWHIKEATSVIQAFPDAPGFLLETGFGPSGELHIGTIIENMRTCMVQRALLDMDQRPARVQCFVDDLDGFRKVPPNLPNQELLQKYLHHPLCEVPDPYGVDASLADRNIRELERAAKAWGFEIEILRASEYYRSGKFNEKLLVILEKHKEILDIILPNLRPERRKTYSPFMPICPETRQVLAVGVCEYRSNTIVYRNPHGRLVEVPVTGGNCKLQWNVDFGMRWAACGVHYEMYGKDVMPSVYLARRVCCALGATPPVGMMYELFLSPEGAKLSKSKGNATITSDVWMRIVPPGSIYYFAHQNPRRAKRIDALQMPAVVDNFLDACNTNKTLDYIPAQFQIKSELPFQLLVALAVIAKGDSGVVRGMLVRRGLIAPSDVLLNAACNFATLVTIKNRVLKTLREDWQYRAVEATIDMLRHTDNTPEAIQAECYEIGKKYSPQLREWFVTLYECLFGDDNGPRIGTFFAYLGRERSIEMLQELLMRSGRELADDTQHAANT